ncbi:hypothetical protein OG474_25365 [Kribbella sp. NBC_01505]|uniref:DUF6531 domain-containing protein n=1 Tax=Kribbella sp. NBC_01505 TaxID=2903580 RepID=UPI00386839C2
MVALVVAFASILVALHVNLPAYAEVRVLEVAKVTSRPDPVSAMVTARSQGTRIEVESMRSETATTWANPDGTMTTEAHMAPVRFRNSSGQWRSVDLDLAKATDGTVAPKGHKLGLRLGKRTAGPGGVFASAASANGGLMEWLAPFRLPEPSVDGTKATYGEVQPGVDLALDARRNGFEADFVVKTRPESAPVWRFPLRTKGLTARAAKSGVVEFVDAKNVVRSRIPVAYMWDAAKDPVTGEPVNKTVVNVSVEQVAPGKATLVVAPNAEWFMDPGRAFPVTVDPTYVAGTASPAFDTFVQTSVETDLSSLTQLQVGRNGTHQNRAFFNFGTAPFRSKDIVSAAFSLYQDAATTCTPTVVNLYGAAPASPDTTWKKQPEISPTLSGSVSAAKGFSGCAAGRISIPMTALARYWSTTPAGTVGAVLEAADESDATAYKRFRSMESETDPSVSFTWNRPPNAPATAEPSEAVAYAAPGETSSALYSSTLRPWVRTKATDPDGNTLKYIFEFYTGSGSTLSVKGTCTSSIYASATTAGCRPSTDLPDNTLLYIRAKANDGRLDGPWVSYNQRLRTGATTPASPVVSCPAPYGNNTWQDTAPTADVKCTLTATGNGYNAPGHLRVVIDGKRPSANPVGGAEGQIKITPSSDSAVAKWDVIFPKNQAGLHTIVTQAETPAGKLSAGVTYKLGWGGTTLTSPSASPRITAADDIHITAAGPPKGTASSVKAKVKWRVSGYGGSDDLVGWNDSTEVPVTDNGAGGVTVDTLWDTMNAESDVNLDFNPDTATIEATPLNPRVPVKLDVQVCFLYGTAEQCTWSQAPGTTVQRLPHAFGSGFPVADAGPGQVALWTGEFNTSSTDVSVPGYLGDMTISRSHTTYESPGNQVTGVFGPGWVAEFDGADVGAAGMRLIDSTRLDGTLVLQDEEGAAQVFEGPSGKRRTSAIFEVGKWVALDEATAQTTSSLSVSGSGAATVVSYTEEDGTVTTWSPSSLPTAAGETVFRPTAVAEVGSASETTYAYGDGGRIARILAPVPEGVTCGTYSASAPLGGMKAGCRALRFEYTTPKPGQVRLSKVWLDTYNPAKAGGADVESFVVATYAYDANAQLAKITDPRSGLSTEYGYNAAGVLSTIKPAGEIPYQFDYLSVDGRLKLDTVKRERPAGDPSGGVAVLGKYVYDVPLSGSGLPDMSIASVARWNQRSVPARGFAVFSPDRPLAGAPTAEDWQYAELHYANAAGYTVNSAKYGAGDWQYTSIDYNDQGNTVRELDERALRLIIDGNLTPGATADQLASTTVYNSEIKNAGGDAVMTPAGTLVTDFYGPARFAALKDGSVAWVRPHTRTTFDQGAPNGGLNPSTSLPYRLATSETSYAQDPGTKADIEITGRTLTDYSAPVAGDADGWAQGRIGKSINDVDLDGVNSSSDIVKLTRYDGDGRVIETRQPASSGTDAGTTKTAYYSSGAQSGTPECGLRPEWAGQVCKTYPAAQPTSASGPTPTLPATTTKAYSYLLAPTVVEEVSGAVKRTTTTTYLADGRAESTGTAVTGLASSTPNTMKITRYDAATGEPATETAYKADGSISSSVTTGRDAWAREVSYQPSGEGAAVTTYDAAGYVARATDANGSTTYTYDGVDADGKMERRGLVTRVDVMTGGSTWTSQGAYESDGSLAMQKLPGGVWQYDDTDASGESTGRRYAGPVTTQNGDGSTTTQTADWLSWSVENDVTGRITHEWTPDGVAFTSPTGGALPYDRRYTYDNASRLTQVNDRTAPSSGADMTDPAQVPCTTRTYSFDRNDNRQSKSTAGTSPDGSCTTDGASTIARVFDTADRPVSGANGSGSYTYDQLGRTVKIPASDAPNSATGDIGLNYYDDDLARSITQGGTTTTFELDALDRRSVETAITAESSTQTIRHYTDGSDNPTWVTQDASTQRYAEMVGDALTLTVDQSGIANLTLANPHGDVVTTVGLPPGGQAASIAGWSNFDEYGNAPVAGSRTGLLDYGWLGAHQRAVSGAGLTLMGVRLYNPTSGLFTSVDPVVGGNPNAYAYPSDSVNRADLSGKMDPDDRHGSGRPSGLTEAEWRAWTNHKQGKPFVDEDYRRARKKIVKQEKYAGDRNKQKRANNKKTAPKKKRKGFTKRVLNRVRNWVLKYGRRIAKWVAIALGVTIVIAWVMINLVTGGPVSA